MPPRRLRAHRRQPLAGDLWEPGQSVEILVDPADAGRAVLRTHAARATPYVVIGWFIVVVGLLTLIASAMLALWVPPPSA
ncbi:MAG: hypothetical protein IPJ15_06335 [Actinomycetales bacterium]|nr:hypothetical protein [Candidatus Phosphoribacter baldrii]